MGNNKKIKELENIIFNLKAEIEQLKDQLNKETAINKKQLLEYEKEKIINEKIFSENRRDSFDRNFDKY